MNCFMSLVLLLLWGCVCGGGFSGISSLHAKLQLPRVQLELLDRRAFEFYGLYVNYN